MSINFNPPWPNATLSIGSVRTDPIDRTTELQTYMNEVASGLRTKIPGGYYWISDLIRIFSTVNPNTVFDFDGCMIQPMPGAQGSNWWTMFLIGSVPDLVGTPSAMASISTLVTSGLSVTRGQTVITTPAASAVNNGDYIFVTNNLLVVNINNNASSICNHELVRVSSRVGNNITLDRPLLRTQNNAQIRRLNNQQLVRNVTVKGGTFIGLDGGRFAVNQIIAGGLIDRITFQDVSVIGFRSDGIKIEGSRDVIMNNLNTGFGPPLSLGYGIGLAAVSSGVVNNHVYSQGRTVTVFSGGTSDVTLNDSRAHTFRVIPTEQPPNYDLGHGQFNQFLTYNRAIGGRLSVANPTWPGDENNMAVYNSHFSEAAIIYSGTRNLIIDGQHPEFNSMTSEIIFTTETSSALGNLIVHGPITIRNCAIRTNINTFTPNTTGLAIKLVSVGSPGLIVPTLPASTTFENCTITCDGGSAPGLLETPANMRLVPTYLCFKDCNITYNTAVSSILRFGTANASVTVDLVNSRFTSPLAPSLVTLGPNCSSMLVRVQNTTWNNNLITTTNSSSWLVDNGSNRIIIGDL